jgi:hypothetical protein
MPLARHRASGNHQNAQRPTVLILIAALLIQIVALHWKTQASTDIGQIAQWWQRWPHALPAIALGRHNLIVIDADRHGGPDGVLAWTTLTAEHGGADSPVVDTPSGGQHFYFLQPEGKPLGNRKKPLPKGINVRGVGGSFRQRTGRQGRSALPDHNVGGQRAAIFYAIIRTRPA